MSLLLFQLVRGAWFIEPVAANAYKPMVVAALKGDQQLLASLMKTKKHKETLTFLSASKTSTYQFGSRKDLADVPSGTIAVTPLQDIVTKQDQMCSYGTQSLMAFMQKADASDNIIGHLLYVDSPGGSVDGTMDFANAIKNLNKPVVAYTDGMMASAAMWIGSAAREIYASNELCTVGSIGTMISYEDWSEFFKSQGIVQKDVYASASTEKNKAFRESQAGNDEPLIEILDVYNAAFLKAIPQNRYGKGLDKDNTLKGQTLFASDGVKYGLIDGIGSMDFALNRVKQLAKK